MAAAVEVRGLRKSYGELEAVRGIDLEVEEGECFAFLGPNGAGKTTTVEILEGYRDRSAGEVRVLGGDPASFDRSRRERIGVVLQSCDVAPELTPREALEQYAGYYPRPMPVKKVLGLVGLGEHADRRSGRLSGGQKRRLDVGLALVGDPDLVFLDEPTTGFDPAARRQAWDVIGGLKELGKTVFLTTHYMDEAQFLADTVAVIARGEIVAQGDPASIGGRDTAPTTVRFVLPEGAAPEDAAAAAGAPAQVENGRVAIRLPDPVAGLHRLTGWAIDRGVELRSLEVRRPSLEDTYLDLVGPEEEEPSTTAGAEDPGGGG